MSVPGLPMCLGVLKHRAPLARGPNLPAKCFLQWIFAYVMQLNFFQISRACMPVLTYWIYLLKGPSMRPHNLTSTGPHLS